MFEIKKLQKEELNILKEIAIICERHNLTWFAIGGTALGAVRHNGFIPWDDDIDIALPRNDYELLLQYAKIELPEPYELICTAGKYKFLFAKIHNKNTTFIENQCIGKPAWYKGVFVDIMPFDGVPNSGFLEKIYHPLLRSLLILYNYKRFGKIQSKSFKDKMINLLPTGAIYKIWNTTIQMFEFEKCYQTCFSWSLRSKKLTFETTIFSDLIWHDFEEIKVPIPRNYDKYLTIHYGDYMQLPPVDQRNCHNNDGIIDLENSFTKYMESENEK